LPILKHLLNIFQVGNIYKHSVPGVNEFVINGVKPCIHIINYVDKYSLKTKKNISYLKWKEIRNAIINKEHLNIGSREILKFKATEINNDYRE